MMARCRDTQVTSGFWIEQKRAPRIRLELPVVGAVFLSGVDRDLGGSGSDPGGEIDLK